MSIGIYKIACLANGRTYIGQSRNIKQRFASQKAQLRGCRHYNAHLQRAWDKYGEDALTFSVIEEVVATELDARERFWIEHLDTVNNGFNATLPTETGGMLITEETRRKMSESRKGKAPWNKGVPAKEDQKQRLRASRLGSRLTAEHRASISRANTGKKLSKEHCDSFKRAWAEGKRDKQQIRALAKAGAKPFTLVNPLGEIVTGTNLAAFARENGLEQRNLSAVVNGRVPSCKGWRAAITGGLN